MEEATFADERFIIIQESGVDGLLSAWDVKLNELAVDLLSKLLTPEPSNRLSAREATEHGWLQAQCIDL